MKEQFVTYEIASELKELGFDEECLAYYTTGNEVTLDRDGNKTNFVLLSEKIRGELSGHGSCKNSLFNWLRDNDKTCGELAVLSNSVSAPFWQQVIDWFREKHNMYIEITYEGGLQKDTSLYSFQIWSNQTNDKSDKMNYYKTREQAILKAIELCKR